MSTIPIPTPSPSSLRLDYYSPPRRHYTPPPFAIGFRVVATHETTIELKWDGIPHTFKQKFSYSIKVPFFVQVEMHVQDEPEYRWHLVYEGIHTHTCAYTGISFFIV